MTTRPRCAVQVDVDSFAILARYYHLAWNAPVEPFYDVAVPRLLELFERHRIAATFFVVGEEARGAVGNWLRRMVDDGHEVASHSHHHPFGLARLSPNALERELADAEEAIAACTGYQPRGFRSPGYDVDEALIARLEARGYAYDSSVFPTILAPAIRVFQALVRLRRPGAHGTLGRTALIAAPRRAYRPSPARLWRRARHRAFVELPVGTLPFLRLPFYGTAHVVGGRRAFDFGYRWVRRDDVVYALHAVDVMGADRDAIDERLLGHPGLRVPLTRKLELLDHVFTRFASTHSFATSYSMAMAHLGESAPR
jgi:hypothetical protein